MDSNERARKHPAPLPILGPNYHSDHQLLTTVYIETDCSELPSWSITSPNLVDKKVSLIFDAFLSL